MKVKVCMIMLMAVAQIASASDMYSISLMMCRNDTVYLDGISVVDGQKTEFTEEDLGYYLKIRSTDGTLLQKRNFGTSFVVHSNPPLVFDIDCFPIYFRVPVCSGGRSIEICKGDTVLYNIDLSQLCNADGVCDEWEYREMCPDDCLCGNSVCGQDEDSSSCPSDCAEGCDYDGVCDEWETEECEDCSKEDDAGIPIYMFALPLLVFGIIGFLLLRKKSGGRPVPNMTVPGGY